MRISQWLMNIYRANDIDLAQPDTPGVKFKNAELILVELALGIVLVFSIFDIGYDIYVGAPTSHLVIDVTLSSMLLFALSILLNRTKKSQSRVAKLQAAFFESRHEAEKAKAQVDQSKRQAEQLRKQAAETIEDKRKLLRGLGEVIDVQLGRWNLSSAEKEIALLLLKGLSHREIAEMRSTSERTVRQQSLNIYAKAGLKGRSDLAAFFLEDMLAPIDLVKTPLANKRETSSDISFDN